MKQDISIILAVHCVMKNKLVCPRLLTATDNITDRENVKRVWYGIVEFNVPLDTV